MSNTLTNVAPRLFSAFRDVPRELTGILGACNLDFNDKGVAKGDTVKVPIAPVASVGAHTAAQTFSAGADRTPTTIDLTLGQSSVSSWNLTAEDERSLMNGDNAVDMLRQTISQHMRAHVNAMESYAWTVARKNASRGAGTAGTVPFASTSALIPSMAQILDDNGAASIDRSLVISTAAAANLRNLSTLFKVNEAGSDALLRTGVLGQLYGFNIRQSAQIVSKTAGTGTNYVSDSSGDLPVGTTSIPIDVGSGTVLAGDVVTWTGDTNKYVVLTGVTAAGTIVIQEPGLKIALPNDTAMTIGAAASAHIALQKNALCMVARPGLQPAGGGIEQMTISDPVTGLAFLLVRAVGDGMASWYLRVVYDAFSPNGYAMAQLLG